MPELPEVETVRRGLAPFLEGARIEGVRLNRPDLRFPFPDGFAGALDGRVVQHAGRRAKYLLFTLDNGNVWLSHLGMTGSFRFLEREMRESGRYYEPPIGGPHDHVVMDIVHPEHGPLTLVYADARRFGFMDLVTDEKPSPFLEGLGPEPLGNEFSATQLAGALRKKRTPIKAALLDQRIVAGLGNIYVCEALHRASIHPERIAADLVGEDGAVTPILETLVASVRTVLLDAIEAGGSTLRDFRNAEGGSGYFQHRFSVYDREGEPCLKPGCGGTVARIVQSGRSTFFCPTCQH